MSTFSWDGRHLPDRAALEVYLRGLAGAGWVRGVVVHHTWKPTPETWNAGSMDGLKRWYRDEVSWTDEQGRRRKGWPAGPHLFVAPDGYWVGTPLNRRGVHAGAYNASWVGVEVVWDGDLKPFSPEVLRQLTDAVIPICHWAGIRSISRDTVRGHRECGSPKTCPGRKNDCNLIRAQLARALAAEVQVAPDVVRYVVNGPSGSAPVRIAPATSAALALAGTARLPNGMVVDIGQVKDGWAWLAPSNPFRDLGFVQIEHLQAEGDADAHS